MRLNWLFAAVGCAVLLGCASSDDEPKYASLSEDPRVGEAQNRICFTRSINGFSEYQNGDGIVLHRSRSERYLVTFVGPCFAARNALAIGLNPRFGGTGCIGRGDRIYLSDSFTGRPTSDSFSSDLCMIRDIYTFDPDAAKAAEESEE